MSSEGPSFIPDDTIGKRSMVSFLVQPIKVATVAFSVPPRSFVHYCTVYTAYVIVFVLRRKCHTIMMTKAVTLTKDKPTIDMNK